MQADSRDVPVIEEEFVCIRMQDDEFSGLIGNFASEYLRNKIGGSAGNVVGDVAARMLDGGGNSMIENVMKLFIILLFRSSRWRWWWWFW
jgi:hypothetical protein